MNVPWPVTALDGLLISLRDEGMDLDTSGPEVCRPIPAIAGFTTGIGPASVSRKQEAHDLVTAHVKRFIPERQRGFSA